MTVTDPGNAVLIPAIRPGSGVIVRQVLPGIAVWTVVLANSAPRALAQVRTPSLPMRPSLPRFFQSKLFVCHLHVHSWSLTNATARVKYSRFRRDSCTIGIQQRGKPAGPRTR